MYYKNTRPTITLLPEIIQGDPEVVSMLQAFYSRSHKPISDRLEELTADTKQTVKEALKKYYLNYGHASIADCSQELVSKAFPLACAFYKSSDVQKFNGCFDNLFYTNHFS